jgi:pilus assembly protein Flp/PilA
MGRLWRDEQGPTAVEYALMLFMVAVAVVAATTGLRDAAIAIFNSTKAALGG